MFSDHFIGTFNPIIETKYEELRLMTKINIEIPMLLNSKLVKNNYLEKNAKVLQFLFPIPENIKSVNHFNSYKLISDSFKHMILCLREDLSKNPVFFALCKIRILEKVSLEILKEKNLLDDEVINTLYSIDTAAKFVEYLLSDKVDPYKFGSSIWDINDKTHQPHWMKPEDILLFDRNKV